MSAHFDHQELKIVAWWVSEHTNLLKLQHRHCPQNLNFTDLQGSPYPKPRTKTYHLNLTCSVTLAVHSYCWCDPACTELFQLLSSSCCLCGFWDLLPVHCFSCRFDSDLKGCCPPVKTLPLLLVEAIET